MPNSEGDARRNGSKAAADFFERGWAVFEPETLVLTWARAARGRARSILQDPDLAHWYQCERTWFVGLDALDNDGCGRVDGSGPLAGRAVDFIAGHCGGWPALHRAQISAVFPGYPRPRAGETEAAFRYRLKRDAAHVDGILGEGSPKRRFVREPHAFILGLPLTGADATAAPLAIWEGSHDIMRSALTAVLRPASGGDLGSVDVTEAYQSARRAVFETCRRVTLPSEPGSAILLHRLLLHGIAPWQPGARAEEGARVIAYFRPPMQGGVADWIARP